MIGPGQTYAGKQGFTYGAGASAETVCAEHVWMKQIWPVPAGGRAKAHYHKGIETIADSLDGEAVFNDGDRLEHRIGVRAGEQVYIPADVPHAPSNESAASCTWIVVHASGSYEDGIILLPDLDALLTSKVGRA